ncbi:hypothetical protein [Blastochloris viridis]|uniref:Carbon monoxide dehydrogenase n=1 Tax=Blastochloris viridis TaxID=1079 RepID=A0A0H5BPY5_BLAVI|nr:hypothetical protein [Blastochloris viridis]ALK10009.1 hypothetical protein BVIR_2241 [Blastochloris viridis]BAS00074.1 hypothetical protein BV133_2480 [Blastochloris viridis]CUU42673.1 hypothetical protein BVIRIDIS_16870 [Blastochloris viridis]
MRAMPRDITGAVVLPAQPHQVFQALNDPDVLKACAPVQPMPDEAGA